MSQHTQHASPLAGVAYDAAAPLNAEVRAAMARNTLVEFLAARSTTVAPVVTLDVNDSVGHAMEVSMRAVCPLVSSSLTLLGIRLCRLRRRSRATAYRLRRCLSQQRAAPAFDRRHITAFSTSRR